MGWKENKIKYIHEYNKEKYYKVSVMIPLNSELYEVIKNCSSKGGTLKELAIKGLHQQ